MMGFGLWFLVFDFYLELKLSFSRLKLMEKANFENLEIYQISETLSDKIWEIVFQWNRLASARIFPKEAVAEVIRITNDFYIWLAARFMKQDIR